MAINDINLKGYIGKTKNLKNRIDAHLRDANKNSSLYFHRAIRKYGFGNFTWIILEECDDDKSNDREIYYISFFRDVMKLYNMTRGGDGGYTIENHPNRLDIIRKSSESRRGENHFTNKMSTEQYEEFCNKCRGENNYMNKMTSEEKEEFLNKYRRGERNPMYGKHFLDGFNKEERELFVKKRYKRGESHWLYGRKHSEEIRKKMSENSKGKNSGSVNCNYGKKGSVNHCSKKYVLTIGEVKIVVIGIGYFVEEYNKHSDVKIYGQLLSTVASGKNKSHRGIVCEYYDEVKHIEVPMWDDKIVYGKFIIIPE
jgi:group I intron endonuclease